MHCFILFSYSDLDMFLCENGGESNKGSVGGSTRLKPPTLARPHSDHSHELFHDRRSSEEQGTNKPPPTARVREGSKGDTACPTTSQNPSLWPPWLSKACTPRKYSESE